MKKPENLTMVIFGASGDLTYRKLIPALFELYSRNMLPEKFNIVGVGRSQLSDLDFRNKMAVGLKTFMADDHDKIPEFLEYLYYQAIDTKNWEDYKILKSRLETLTKGDNCAPNYLYYLAMPPSMYATISESLSKVGLQNNENGWKRVIIEKPFGYDLETALHLNRELQQYFPEDDIYRIDHYLGKETVQNIMVTRFSNGIFEPLWNRNFIERVEITSCESIGLGGRGGYYDTSGALRDMLQNHLMQLVGLVAMEPPATSDSNSIRNEILKVFQSLRRIHEKDVPKSVIRGQYVASKVRGEEMLGYREEEGVADDSRTETFAAMKFFIDNWRWSGVPFYIRTGKRLPTRVTEIVIHFKPTPHRLFRKKSVVNESEGNELIIRIQPDEGLLMKFDMKIPGEGFRSQQVNMDFHYSELQHEYIPLAYARLLHDCMLGDSTLFQRSDGVEESWRFVEPILRAWKNDDVPLHGYPAGTWGPEEVNELMEGNMKSWRYPCKNLANDGNYCEL